MRSSILDPTTGTTTTFLLRGGRGGVRSPFHRGHARARASLRIFRARERANWRRRDLRTPLRSWPLGLNSLWADSVFTESTCCCVYEHRRDAGGRDTVLPTPSLLVRHAGPVRRSLSAPCPPTQLPGLSRRHGDFGDGGGGGSIFVRDYERVRVVLIFNVTCAVGGGHRLPKSGERGGGDPCSLASPPPNLSHRPLLGPLRSVPRACLVGAGTAEQSVTYL